MKEVLCAVSKYLTAWLHARTAGAKNSGGTPVANNNNKYRNLFRPSPRRKIKDRLRLSDLLSKPWSVPYSHVLLQIAFTKGIDVCVAATLPFMFEGPRRMIAQTSLDAMMKTGVSIFVYDHEIAITKETGQSLIAAFGLAEKTLADNVFSYLKTKR